MFFVATEYTRRFLLINADYQPTGLTTPHNAITIGPKKKIALVAHDNKKVELVEWARFNSGLLHDHELYATGTTGTMLANVLHTDVKRFQSGPLGGDLQIASAIVARDRWLDLFLGSFRVSDT